MSNYLGDDAHLLDHEDGHIRIDCWCEPELMHVGEDHFLLHKNEAGETILTDPNLKN